MIPEEPEVRKSVFDNVPLVDYKPYSRASLEFNRLAYDLVGQDYAAPRLPGLRRAISRFGIFKRFAK